MKCPLKIFRDINPKYCLTYLPDRLMFQSFGLSPLYAWIATFEYGLAAGYIHCSNIERDCIYVNIVMNAKKTKQIIRNFLGEQLRKHLKKADLLIAEYEARDASLDEYIDMVEAQGNKLFKIIVAPKHGNVNLAGKVGGLLAKLTDLDTLIQNRDYNVANNRYNPIKNVGNLQKAQEMINDCREELINILGKFINKETLCANSLIAKFEKVPIPAFVRQKLSLASILPLLKVSSQKNPCQEVDQQCGAAWYDFAKFAGLDENLFCIYIIFCVCLVPFICGGAEGEGS